MGAQQAESVLWVSRVPGAGLGEKTINWCGMPGTNGKEGMRVWSAKIGAPIGPSGEWRVWLVAGWGEIRSGDQEGRTSVVAACWHADLDLVTRWHHVSNASHMPRLPWVGGRYSTELSAQEYPRVSVRTRIPGVLPNAVSSIQYPGRPMPAPDLFPGLGIYTGGRRCTPLLSSSNQSTPASSLILFSPPSFDSMKRVALWALVGLILSMAVLSCSASDEGERAKRPARRDCNYDDHDDCDDEYEVAYGYGKSWGACEDDDDCPPIALILELEEQEGGDDSCWEEDDDDDDDCTWPTSLCWPNLLEALTRPLPQCQGCDCDCDCDCDDDDDDDCGNTSQPPVTTTTTSGGGSPTTTTTTGGGSPTTTTTSGGSTTGGGHSSGSGTLALPPSYATRSPYPMV